MKNRKPYSLQGAVISIVLLLLVMSPVIQNWNDEPVDGFPLSHYPMFTKVRGKRLSITHPVGFTADNTPVNLPGWTAGAGGMNQIRKRMTRMVAGGQGGMLCATVAGRVAHSNDPELAPIVSVAIVRSTYDIDGYFRGRREPVKRGSYAFSRVRRAGDSR